MNPIRLRLLGKLSAGLLLLYAPGASAQAEHDVLSALVAAYPDVLLRHDGSHVYWRDGTAMLANDGRQRRSFDDLLKDASIVDQFSLRYPRGRLRRPPKLNDDPGRFRNEAFFKKLYGDCHTGVV